MASAVYSSTSNTAAVLEFNCLYTHDIRRKQKRWKDGFLRFHTFNNRVMVYDVPRNFIGDVHWTRDEVVQDGDEMMLDKGGAIVQVAENVGRTETDLTELRRSVKKAPNGKIPSSPLRRPPQSAERGAKEGARSVPRVSSQFKHRSLNALLGTAKGPIGKAILSETSPFQRRLANAENDGWESHRSPKRQCIEGVATSNATWATEAMQPTPRSEVCPPKRSADVAKPRKKTNLSPNLTTRKTLDSRVEQVLERPFTASANDSHNSNSSISHVAVSARKPTTVRSSSPSSRTQTPAEPNPGTPFGHTSGNDASMRTQPPTLQGIGGQVNHTGPVQTLRREEEMPSGACLEAPVVSKPGSILRLAAGPSKKKTLLCQNQVPKQAALTSSFDADVTAGVSCDATATEDGIPQAKAERQRLADRLERICKKVSKPAHGHSRNREHAYDYLEEVGGSEKIVAPDLSDSDLKVANDTNVHKPMQTDQRHLSPKCIEIVEPQCDAYERAERANSQCVPGQGTISLSSTPPQAGASSPRSKRKTDAPARSNPSPSSSKITYNAATTQVASANPVKHAQATMARRQLGPDNRIAKIPQQRAVGSTTSAKPNPRANLNACCQPPRSSETKESALPQLPDPWSREAFDLFSWRPPRWNEERWCVESDKEGTVEVSLV